MPSRYIKIAAWVVAAVPAAAFAADTAYPSRPIRVVIPFPPGGSTDLLARMMAQRLTDAWGQQAVPDNRVGANGIVASEIVAKRPRTAEQGPRLRGCDP